MGKLFDTFSDFAMEAAERTGIIGINECEVILRYQDKSNDALMRIWEDKTEKPDYRRVAGVVLENRGKSIDWDAL